ncbi:MAG: LysM peptidoglycan-binding domain-containing protein [Acidimicrobiales bacterium]
MALVMIGCAWPDDAAATTVRVSPGNTLTQIANTYGTSVAALVADNGIGDPDLIEAGTVIDVPTAPTSSYATARSTSASTSTSSGSVTVTVTSGETLWSLASQYGTSVAAIVDANGIGDPSHVEIGAQLVVPEGAAYGGAGSGSGGLLSAQVQRSTLPAGLLSHPERLALRPLFEQWASDSGVPVALLEAMCWWESGWQMSAVSSTGAVGVGQLEPSTVAKLRVSLGQPGLQATNTSDNIEMAAAYLHQLLVQTGGDEDRALAGYYQGLPSVQRSGMFASTVQYVHGILSFTDLFA